MEDNKMQDYLLNVIQNMPSGWLNTTTHRLDIYDESLAKTQFLNEFETLFKKNNFEPSALNKLPTAYDYIRLGHPLSCILEWSIAKLNKLNSENVISFSSQTMPILAILRKNSLNKKKTLILYSGKLPEYFDKEILEKIYGYDFELKEILDINEVPEFKGGTVYVSNKQDLLNLNLNTKIDFYITSFSSLGSILVINGAENESYISDIQHVRRRETISMTPANSLSVIELLLNKKSTTTKKVNLVEDKSNVLESINKITGTTTKVLVSSSGLSIQYAILMGLIHDAQEKHKGKPIRIIVPPNCYGGTNDQARRVAACIENVEITDLPVDGGNDMVQSIDTVLEKIASEDAVPYIIAEIPTNPRVEVPNLIKLREVLSRKRQTATGSLAIDPVFILDQTFCPNVQFLGEGEMLSTVRTISFASGSKFPSGGLCTAGYCVGNTKTVDLIEKIELHLTLCDNEATQLQYEILAKQLPTMNKRIIDAYKNTRDFVNFINDNLPTAKINFVSEELANQGFTPSVFSLDLPTKGENDEEKENYKRALNLKLINLMISEIPNESKYCVSYGQLNGCYWTIPATSTQGTTKEGDKDYIARVALSANMDMDLHKKVFLDFVKSI